MADKLFRLEIIEPDGIFYTGDVEMVEYNTTEGEVGVYAGHIPMTQIIAPGILTITTGDEEKKATLLSGFVEITEDKVSILAEAAEWPDQIDVARAEAARDRAQKRLEEKGGADLLRAEIALKKALLRIEAAKKY